MSDDLFKEYGYSQSIVEAIENLAVVCGMNGQKCPTKIIFPKETIDFISLNLKVKERIPTLDNKNYNIEIVKTSFGTIKIEEER